MCVRGHSGCDFAHDFEVAPKEVVRWLWLDVVSDDRNIREGENTRSLNQRRWVNRRYMKWRRHAEPKDSIVRSVVFIAILRSRSQPSGN